MVADLTQNAVEAKSTEVIVEFIETVNFLTVYIRDNGKGMSPETLSRIKDPFYTDGVKHPKRKVGLGVPFLIQTIAETGGDWDITSKLGVGTTVYAKFDLQNIDTPPMGDVPGLFRQLLTFPGDYEMRIIRKKTENGASAPKLDYTVIRSDLIDALGGLENAGSLVLLGEYLTSQETDDE